MKKNAVKKLTLNKESILRLDLSDLQEVLGGLTTKCTNTAQCTETCSASGCTC